MQSFPFPFHPGKVTELKVVVVGSSQVEQRILINAAWQTIYERYRGPDVHKLHEEYMGKKHLLHVHNVGSSMREDSASNLVTDADAVVLAFDSQKRPGSLDVMAEIWLPRVNKYARKKAPCFVVEYNTQGRRTHGEDDLEWDSEALGVKIDVQLEKKEFVGFYEIDSHERYHAFIRKLFDGAKSVITLGDGFHVVNAYEK